MENVIVIIAVFSFGFWSSKRKNSRIGDIIFLKERTHFLKCLLFAVEFDVKWANEHSSLFVCLVCDRPNKKTAEIQWLYFASNWFRFGNCSSIREFFWLFSSSFVDLSVSFFFSLSLFLGKWDSCLIGCFVVWFMIIQTRKQPNGCHHLSKRKNSLLKMFAFCSRFDVKCPLRDIGCLFVWSVIVQTKKKKNSRDLAASVCIKCRFRFGDFVIRIFTMFLFFFLFPSFGSFYLLSFVFWENSSLLWLFCCLVLDHPNEKTAKWVTSFVQKMNSFLKMFALFCSRFDVKCVLESRLFVCLVCDRSNALRTLKLACLHWFGSAFLNQRQKYCFSVYCTIVHGVWNWFQIKLLCSGFVWLIWWETNYDEIFQFFVFVLRAVSMFRRMKCFVFSDETKKKVLGTKRRSPFFFFFFFFFFLFFYVLFCFAKKESVESLRQICEERKRIERKQRKTKRRKRRKRRKKKKKKKNVCCFFGWFVCFIWNPSKSVKETFRCSLFCSVFICFFFFLWVCFFGKMSVSIPLFCRLVSDHPNEKTAEWRISFVQKKELFWKCLLFAVEFDVKSCDCLAVCLFGLWSSKQKNSRDSMALFCIRIRFRFGNCWFVFGRSIRCLFFFCYLNWRRQRNYRFLFLFSSLLLNFWFCLFRLFRFFSKFVFWENVPFVCLFCRLVSDHPNEKNSRMEDIICPKERTHFWKRIVFLQSIWCEVCAGPRMFVCLVCDRPNKKKQPRVSGFILHEMSISIWLFLEILKLAFWEGNLRKNLCFIYAFVLF